MARKKSTLQRLPLAPVIGAMFGVAAAILVAAVPVWLFEQAVGASGIVVRVLAIVAAFAVVGLASWGLVWAVERLMVAPAPKREEAGELDLGAFDEALPIANEVRRPISAVELGAPLMSDEALQTVAPFVEQLAAEPEPEPEPQPEERVVAAVVEVAVPPPANDEQSIEALIARLEAGLANYGKPQPPRPGGAAATPAAIRSSSWIVRHDDSDDSDPVMLKRVLAG